MKIFILGGADKKVVREIFNGEDGGWDSMVKLRELGQIWVGRRSIFFFF